MDYKELVKAVNQILSEYSVKMTLRQIYYRLVSKGLIPNTKASYKGLSKQLVKARESGEVPDNRIEDRSRKVQGTRDSGWDNTEDFLKAYANHFRRCGSYWDRKMWTNQDKKVLIALEKDALSRLFVDAASDYRVQVYATRGYGSYTFVNDMAGDLSTEKENVILYFGDYDPSGRDIERDLTDRLIRYFGSDNFTVVRIALTPEQISKYGLPPMPEDAETLAKLKRDPRSKQYGMTYAVELDAIEPDELQRLIQAAIKGQVDLDLWQEDLDIIEAEKAELEEKLKGVTITLADGTTL